jgi:hypothetical protein
LSALWFAPLTKTVNLAHFVRAAEQQQAWRISHVKNGGALLLKSAAARAAVVARPFVLLTPGSSCCASVFGEFGATNVSGRDKTHSADDLRTSSDQAREKGVAERLRAIERT